MHESVWVRSAAYSVVAIIAVGSWAIGQINVDSHKATLPIVAYMDCLKRFETIEWPTQSGGSDGLPRHPSGSEVCKDLSR